MADSENTTTLSRCAILGAIPAAAAVALPASAIGIGALKPAFAASSPSAIEVEYAEYQRLTELWSDADDLLSEAQERYEAPPRPGFNYARSEGASDVVRSRDGKGYCYLSLSKENIADLKETIAVPIPEPNGLNDIDPWWVAKRAERAEKTLAQIEEYLAEVKRRKDAAGLTEAEQNEALADKAMVDQRLKTFAMKAENFRDLAYVANVAATDFDAWAIVERLVKLARIEA